MTIHVMEFPQFVSVDTTPYFIRDETVREIDLYREPYFRPIDDGKEIFIREATVQEILQVALDKQEPEMTRIREARRAEAKREEYRIGGRLAAKIIAV